MFKPFVSFPATIHTLASWHAVGVENLCKILSFPFVFVTAKELSGSGLSLHLGSFSLSLAATQPVPLWDCDYCDVDRNDELHGRKTPIPPPTPPPFHNTPRRAFPHRFSLPPLHACTRPPTGFDPKVPPGWGGGVVKYPRGSSISTHDTLAS